MNVPRVRLALVLLFSVAFAAPALAQYMYLDSNGDGIHTSADQVNAVGPTVIDIWLDTDSNRDGSAAVCATANQPLDIISYVFVLRATDGTVTWGTFTNRQPSMGAHFGEQSSPTEYRNGYGGPTIQPPGLYRLGTLQMSIASGQPSLQIVPQETGGPEPTSFGSRCPGVDDDNTMKLSTDWFDVDGLPFGTAGGSNTAPILTQPSNMSLSVGESASQVVTATDADRQPVTFSKVSGPAFAAVTTVDPGSGTATGKVYLAPRIADVGTAMVSVGASDGTASDQETFAVTVVSGPNHEPALVGPNETDVVAGFVRRARLEALDPDGQALTFAKTSGPDFATVSTLTSGPGAAAGSLRLTPTLCEVGDFKATVAVTDGLFMSQVELRILVRSPSPAAPSPPPIPLPDAGTAVAVADLNSDGHLDIVAASYSTPTRLSILLGNGNATFNAITGFDIAGIEPTSIAVGDFNGDKKPDIAVATFTGGNLQVFLGRGDGTFGDGSTLGPLSGPFHVTAVDVNADDHLDLIVGGEGAGASLFLGAGDGTFGAKQDINLGGGQRWLAIADFDRDGVLDLAASLFQKRTVAVLYGFGDGTFGNLREIPFGEGAPYATIAGDWNWDGKIDLAVSGYEGGRVVPFLGDGEGGFAAAEGIVGFFSPQSLAAADFNSDGNPDLLVGDPSGPGLGSTQIAYGAGDGRFAAPRLIAPTAFGIASGDVNEDGFPDAVTVNASVNVWLNDAAGLGAAQARAFERDDVLRPFPILSAIGPECLRLEPVGGSYENSELNYSSITLRSEGTGSVDEIRAIAINRPIPRDLDRNGIAEVPVCFERRDFTRLFDKIQGKQTVTAQLEGALANGRRFCTPVDLDIVNHKRRFFAHLTPNPLNPQATLKFSTTGDGFVRVRVFDLNGRLVRTLLDSSQLPAGDHEVVVDGRGRNGERLASGVYFYRIEAQEGSIQGRMTVLK